MIPLNRPQTDYCESIWSVAKVLLAFFNRYSLSAFVFVRARQKLGAPSIVRSIYSNPPELYWDPLSSESLQLWSAARSRQTAMGKDLPIPFITDLSHHFCVNSDEGLYQVRMKESGSELSASPVNLQRTRLIVLVKLVNLFTKEQNCVSEAHQEQRKINLWTEYFSCMSFPIKVSDHTNWENKYKYIMYTSNTQGTQNASYEVCVARQILQKCSKCLKQNAVNLRKIHLTQAQYSSPTMHACPL